MKIVNTHTAPVGLSTGIQLQPGENDITSADFNKVKDHPTVKRWLKVGFIRVEKPKAEPKPKAD